MTTETESAIVAALLQDRKRDRRWKNIRFFIWLIVIAFFFLTMIGVGTSLSQGDITTKGFDSTKPYVALIRLNGMILPEQSFSAAKVVPRLQKAFKDKRALAVILDINSPGGSPVQASEIYDSIVALKSEHPNKPIIVVGEDYLASGAYLVATAADKIFVNRDTLTGSIGVVMEGFGFTDLINKIGVERRIFQSGKYKVQLDPFQPINPENRLKMQTVLNEVHQNFINDVKAGRGQKLKEPTNVLFTGDFWTGQQAVKLGLADGTANLWQVMQQYHVNQYKDYSVEAPFYQQFFHQVGTTLHLALMENQYQLSV